MGKLEGKGQKEKKHTQTNTDITMVAETVAIKEIIEIM
jgi:hypothetical protein